MALTSPLGRPSGWESRKMPLGAMASPLKKAVTSAGVELQTPRGRALGDSTSAHGPVPGACSRQQQGQFYCRLGMYPRRLVLECDGLTAGAIGAHGASRECASQREEQTQHLLTCRACLSCAARPRSACLRPRPPQAHPRPSQSAPQPQEEEEQRRQQRTHPRPPGPRPPQPPMPH